MKRLIISGILLALIQLIASAPASAGISMEIKDGRSMLDFRAANPGDTVELADQGSYHNEIICSSTNNMTWYLKQQLIRPFTSGSNTMPAESFRWEVADIVDGKGVVTNNIRVRNPFTTMQGIIYTSADLDNTGTEVKLRFRYSVDIPRNQTAGVYDAVVRFTMNELL